MSFCAPAIEYITIDIEGYEWEVLQSFSPIRWQPKVIIIERCFYEYDPRILAYMELNGYEHFRITPPGAKHACNDWYWRSASNTAD